MKQKTEISDDRVMLTGDENIVNIEFTIQWKIKNAQEFVLNTRSPERTLKVVGESVMREVVGQTPILPIVSGSGWAEINTQAQTVLQNLSDEYKLGIQIINIKLQKASPPEAVNEAFQDVQNARTDKARLSNEAEGYRNDILPRARAEAIKITQDALGYKESLVAEAQGEANRFTAVLSEYEKNPEVTLKRMQLKNMQRVLEKNSKVFIDPSIGKNILQVLPGLDLKKTEGK
jgi:membrane protease subunit HflK